MVKEYGISLAVNMITKLVQENDIPGVHFFTLNLEKSVQRILEALKWTGVAEHAHNKLIAVCCSQPCFDNLVNCMF